MADNSKDHPTRRHETHRTLPPQTGWRRHIRYRAVLLPFLCLRAVEDGGGSEERLLVVHGTGGDGGWVCIGYYGGRGGWEGGDAYWGEFCGLLAPGWLPVGAQVVNTRLEELDMSALVIAG